MADSLCREDGGKLRAFIADDSLFMRESLAGILLPAGCAVAGEAADADEAERLCAELQPDLIMIDLAMPGSAVLPALGAIRRECPGAVMLACCSLGQQELVLKALHMGADDFVVKPYRGKSVIEAVRGAQARRGAKK